MVKFLKFFLCDFREIKNRKIPFALIRANQWTIFPHLCVIKLILELHKEVNQAVKNNPDKFPKGYIITVNKNEKGELVKNFDRFKTLKHSSVPIKAFTDIYYYL